MTEPIRPPAPDAIGDIVDGEPPVPITVWHVPAARAADTMSSPLAQRLVANFAHPRDLIIDVTRGSQLAQAASAARRRHRRHQAADLASGKAQAVLLVSGWPAGDVPVEDFLASCAAQLAVGGCAAVVLTDGEVAFNQSLIAAARAAGLTYLQHIVAAHDLSDRHGQLDDGTHIRVHSDVLIFSAPQLGDENA
jgi:hypothetical protein